MNNTNTTNDTFSMTLTPTGHRRTYAWAAHS